MNVCALASCKWKQSARQSAFGTGYLLRLSYGECSANYLDATKTGLYKAGACRLTNEAGEIKRLGGGEDDSRVSNNLRRSLFRYGPACTHRVFGRSLT
jgi:hypothetical protein